MTINRREFLKRAYQIGGLAGLYAMGGQNLINEALAKSTFISGHVSGGSYANWNETDEAGWGDSVNVNICLAQATTVANEISQGVLTGANLIYTQNGAIAGGDGTKRPFDGVNDMMSATNVFANTFLSFDDPTFLIIHKLDTVNKNSYDTGVNYIDCTGNTEMLHTKIQFNNDGDNTLGILWKDAGAYAANTETVDVIPLTGIVYIYQQANAGKIQAGWDTVKRTAWADIPAGQKLSVTATLTWAGVDFDTNRYVVGGLGTAKPAWNWHYSIFAKKTLEQISA